MSPMKLCACLQVCGVLSGALLPALTQHYSNMGLANMLWDVMAHMPFAYRAEVRMLCDAVSSWHWIGCFVRAWAVSGKWLDNA